MKLRRHSCQGIVRGSRGCQCIDSQRTSQTWCMVNIRTGNTIHVCIAGRRDHWRLQGCAPGGNTCQEPEGIHCASM
jgi:hypothetical protein